MNDKINKEPKEEGIELMEIFEMIKAKSKTIRISLIVAFIVAILIIAFFSFDMVHLYQMLYQH